MRPVRHILVAVDFDQGERRAVDVAAVIAERFNATITLVHVMYPSPRVTPIWIQRREDAELRLQNLLAPLRVTAKCMVRFGAPAQEIVEAAQTLRADIVVVGTHGRHRAARAFLGSVSEEVMRTSPVPVLTVLGAPPDEAGS
ncbi:universal stress protein [Pendulispora brunnea]|uniref:Universal stress protein n=1 Tax=Pendulispora brunnea TaxID=2905690 RepID=A0ABZ2JYU1_9BACT